MAAETDMNGVLLQESMDRFLQWQRDEDPALSVVAERCFETFSEYLLNYSDLFEDGEASAEDEMLAEWEQALDSHMERLFEGDVSPAYDLGTLKLSHLEVEHLRDFLGWYMLRDAGIGPFDEDILHNYAQVLRNWIGFLARKNWISEMRRIEFVAGIAELEPECQRASNAAKLLLHFVRLGHGVAPRMRAFRFTDFVEGHARVDAVEGCKLYLRFDNREQRIGPVMLPETIAGMLHCGDVLDVELGLRGDAWVIVDIGPVYPVDIYVDAEQFHFDGKLPM